MMSKGPCIDRYNRVRGFISRKMFLCGTVLCIASGVSSIFMTTKDTPHVPKSLLGPETPLLWKPNKIYKRSICIYSVTHSKNIKKKKRRKKRSSLCVSAVAKLTITYEHAGSIPGLAQWAKDPALLWLWYRLAAVAPSRPLAWEIPYATSVALKKKKNLQEFPLWFSKLRT